jgi:shikimate kinase
MKGPIVITGFMGCGKTKVARALAARLNLVMVDLDDYITMRIGRTPADLIIKDSEPTFRDIETEALRELLQREQAGVISLGGGAWIEKTNRDLIERYSCVSVWLDVPFEVCWARIERAEQDRPLGRTRTQALELYKRRQPIYQLAKIHIKRRDEDVDDVLSRIEESLG